MRVRGATFISFLFVFFSEISLFFRFVFRFVRLYGDVCSKAGKSRGLEMEKKERGKKKRKCKEINTFGSTLSSKMGSITHFGTI